MVVEARNEVLVGSNGRRVEMKSTNIKLTASRIGEASTKRLAIGVLAYSPSATSATTPAAVRTLIMRTRCHVSTKGVA